MFYLTGLLFRLYNQQKPTTQHLYNDHITKHQYNPPPSRNPPVSLPRQEEDGRKQAPIPHAHSHSKHHTVAVATFRRRIRRNVLQLY